MLKNLGQVTEPTQTIANCGEGLWLFSFIHTPDYLHDSSAFEINVLFESFDQTAAISLFTDNQTAKLIQDSAASRELKQITNDYQLPYLNLSSNWPLEVVSVPKPWGAEIWYTGIESRGVCTSEGIPLPWLLDCLPADFVGSSTKSQPLLLKILDPLPNPSLGDLYFELHDKKIEVYVVTHVDTDVWPDGAGKIRYGFNQTLKSTYSSDKQFKADYLNSVEAYQACRNEIDDLLEQARSQANFSPEKPVPAALMVNWLEAIPNQLQKRESDLRQAMEAFTHFKDIAVGDVITVEPFFPHSLQHGVRVIEFQTASYERFILSFGQKVLTQSHWDTKKALDSAILTMPPENDFASEQPFPGVRTEVIADFTAFTAHRVTLDAGASYQLPASDDYRLAICASGQLNLDDQPLEAEAARFIPKNGSHPRLTAAADSQAICIIAEPKAAEPKAAEPKPV